MSRVRSIRAQRLLPGIAMLWSCTAGEREVVRIGPGERADLVVVFRRDAPTDSIDQFPTAVLSRSIGDGEYEPPPGLQTMNNGYRIEGHRVMALDFHRGATASERAAVRATLERSALVYRIFQDTAPAQLSFGDTAETRHVP